MVPTIDLAHPYTVQNNSNALTFFVMNANDPLPAGFMLKGTTAKERVCMRIGGGCKNMTYDDQLGMLEFFSVAFQLYGGIIWSGASREMVTVDNKLVVNPMVTEVPGMVARQNPGAYACGSLPRTFPFRIMGESVMVVSKYGAILNPTQESAVCVQQDATDPMEWDGDLPVYMKMMRYWQQYAQFSSMGLTIWNGGDVTKQEARMVASEGWPVFVIEGSGRGADELLAEGFGSSPNVVVVNKRHPELLHKAYIKHGFIHA